MNARPRSAGLLPRLHRFSAPSGALGIAVIGEVFFSQLADSASYGHAFAATAVLQVALLAATAVITLFLPRRIAPSAYQQHR
jgi:hypothetical protein